MRVYSEIEPYVDECVQSCEGLQLYGCEMTPSPQGTLLRVFIEGKHPITANDCHIVGQQIRNQAAVTLPAILQYKIEISSPGLDRILFTLAHCEANLGKKIKCKCKLGVDGRKNFSARLHAVNGNQISIATDNDVINIDWHDIDKIRLIYEPE